VGDGLRQFFFAVGMGVGGRKLACRRRAKCEISIIFPPLIQTFAAGIPKNGRFWNWNCKSRQIPAAGRILAGKVGTPGGVSKRSQFVQIWC